MDKIIMQNMTFYGYHGVLPEENKLGQKFIVSAELYLDLKKAGQSDDVQDTVSYADVYEVIKHHMEKKQYKLLEALAEDIAEAILSQYGKIQEILIHIEKPEAPVKGIFDFFGVEIRRKRDGSKA